jgi:hypothetical protein
VTARSIPPKTEAVRDAFLVEMASSYWQARAAITEFKSHAQDACKRCLSRHRLAIGRALGKRIPQGSLKPYSHEDADVVVIGAEARFVKEGRVYVGASWAPDDDGRIEASIFASLLLKDAKASAAFGHAVHGLRSKKTGTYDDHETWYAEVIAADDFPRLSERLEPLLAGWERVLAKVGPLKDLRK